MTFKPGQWPYHAAKHCECWAATPAAHPLGPLFENSKYIIHISNIVLNIQFDLINHMNDKLESSLEITLHPKKNMYVFLKLTQNRKPFRQLDRT